MPFKKGNQLWAKGVAAKKEKAEKIDMLMAMVAGTGMDRYAEIMDKLSEGTELSKAEEQYLDRVDSWREYVRPKLARKELTGKDGKDLPTPILANVIPSYNSNTKDIKSKKKN